MKPVCDRVRPRSPIRASPPAALPPGPHSSRISQDQCGTDVGRGLRNTGVEKKNRKNIWKGRGDRMERAGDTNLHVGMSSVTYWLCN